MFSPTQRVKTLGLGLVLTLVACQGPEEFFRGLLDGGTGLPPVGGQGGGPGAGGASGGTGGMAGSPPANAKSDGRTARPSHDAGGRASR